MLEPSPSPPAVKQRWRPLPSGYVALAKITICHRPDGQPDFKSYAGERWCTVMLGVQGSNYNRRRIWQKLVIEGSDAAKAATRATVTAWLSCHENPITDLRISRLDGLIVPFKATLEQRFAGKKLALFAGPKPAGTKTTNGAIALSADPEHELYEDYMRLARRIGPEQRLIDGGELVDVLPGWRLYPDAPAHKLLMKRELRPADERWRKNAERAIAAMAAGAARVGARGIQPSA